MRYLALFVGFVSLAGCNTAQSARKAVDQEYAIGSYEQSLKAYQLCAEQNSGDPDKCSALARVMEADRKRYEKESPSL